jgi:hypothetical protein
MRGGGLCEEHTCTSTMPTPNKSVNVLLNALTSTPAPSPSILPNEICFTAAGLRLRESVVRGVRASRE